MGIHAIMDTYMEAWGDSYIMHMNMFVWVLYIVYLHIQYIYIYTHAFWPAQDLVLSELVLWRVSTKVSHDNTRENDFVFEGPPCLNLAVKAISLFEIVYEYVNVTYIWFVIYIYIHTRAHIYTCTHSIVTQYWWWKCMVFVIEFVVPKRATTFSCLRVTWLWNGYSPALHIHSSACRPPDGCISPHMGSQPSCSQGLRQQPRKFVQVGGGRLGSWSETWALRCIWKVLSTSSKSEASCWNESSRSLSFATPCCSKRRCTAWLTRPTSNCAEMELSGSLKKTGFSWL